MALELIFSLPQGSAIDHRAFFGAAVSWADAFFNAPILSAAVHLDEAAPHCHVLILPLVGGRMNGGALAGGPSKIRMMQADFQSAVGKKFGLVQQGRAKRLSLSERNRAGAQVLDALRTEPARMAHPNVRDALIAALGKHHEELFAALGLELPAPSKPKAKSFVAIMTASCKPDRPARRHTSIDVQPTSIDVEPLGITERPPQIRQRLSCVDVCASRPPFPAHSGHDQSASDMPASDQPDRSTGQPASSRSTAPQQRPASGVDDGHEVNPAPVSDQQRERSTSTAKQASTTDTVIPASTITSTVPASTKRAKAKTASTILTGATGTTVPKRNRTAARVASMTSTASTPSPAQHQTEGLAGKISRYKTSKAQRPSAGTESAAAVHPSLDASPLSTVGAIPVPPEKQQGNPCIVPTGGKHKAEALADAGIFPSTTMQAGDAPALAPAAGKPARKRKATTPALSTVGSTLAVKGATTDQRNGIVRSAAPTPATARSQRSTSTTAAPADSVAGPMDQPDEIRTLGQPAPARSTSTAAHQLDQQAGRHLRPLEGEQRSGGSDPAASSDQHLQPAQHQHVTTGQAPLQGGAITGTALAQQQGGQEDAAGLSSNDDYERVSDEAQAAEYWDSDLGEFVTMSATPAKRTTARTSWTDADDLPGLWLDARPGAIDAALDSIRAVHGLR